MLTTWRTVRMTYNSSPGFLVWPALDLSRRFNIIHRITPHEVKREGADILLYVCKMENAI